MRQKMSDISPSLLFEILRSDPASVLLIDVRTTLAFSRFRINGAIHLMFMPSFLKKSSLLLAEKKEAIKTKDDLNRVVITQGAVFRRRFEVNRIVLYDDSSETLDELVRTNEIAYLVRCLSAEQPTKLTFISGGLEGFHALYPSFCSRLDQPSLLRKSLSQSTLHFSTFNHSNNNSNNHNDVGPVPMSDQPSERHSAEFVTHEVLSTPVNPFFGSFVPIRRTSSPDAHHMHHDHHTQNPFSFFTAAHHPLTPTGNFPSMHRGAEDSFLRPDSQMVYPHFATCAYTKTLPPAASEITPFLYVGSEDNSRDVSFFQSHQITHVLNLLPSISPRLSKVFVDDSLSPLETPPTTTEADPQGPFSSPFVRSFALSLESSTSLSKHSTPEIQGDSSSSLTAPNPPRTRSDSCLSVSKLSLVVRNVPLHDSHHENLLAALPEAVDFIEEARLTGGKVLVHCLSGISRSPAIAIAYLMTHRHLSFHKAFEFVRERRPAISPNMNFLGQLALYEKSLSKGKVDGEKLNVIQNKNLGLNCSNFNMNNNNGSNDNPIFPNSVHVDICVNDENE